MMSGVLLYMKTAKIFKSGNSQALRLPKEFRFHSKEVEIFKRGKDIIIREKPKNLKHAFELLASMPEDFFSAEREDQPPQERESF
jgi:antitoxin VapB